MEEIRNKKGFVRKLGKNRIFFTELEELDLACGEKMQQGKLFYKRILDLPKLCMEKDISYYCQCYDDWVRSSRRKMRTKSTGEIESVQKILGDACWDTVLAYQKCVAGMTPSIEKNFIVKLMFWFDYVLEGAGQQFRQGKPGKVVLHNLEKKQEYVFCYLLSRSDIDVTLYLNEQDITLELEALDISEKVVIGQFEKCSIPQQKLFQKIAEPPVVKLQERERKSSVISPSNGEKSYEELARLASSVVMIAIHNEKGDVIGTGSGIMVGKKGYILTNNHVACGGQFYSVRMEEDEEIYPTDEVIKYNPVLDLAIIRIQKELTPIPVYNGAEPLVRGQRVVAIGSPLGLFNSVSDGIISGFRTIDNVDMIQFTAPISHGSSGGAVLNTKGEIIGISTAGIDAGQNINLAMGYECINDFIKGFIGC